MSKRTLPSKKRTAQILRKARNILEKKWIQGSYVAYDTEQPELPKVCLIGALHYAVGEVVLRQYTYPTWEAVHTIEEEAYTRGPKEILKDYQEFETDRKTAEVAVAAHTILECIHKNYTSDWWSLPEFNDDKDTTLADVLKVVDCAIAKTEEIVSC